jgi:hypothetical protein
MPKAQVLTPARVIDYFKTANLETADLVLGLVTNEVRGRKQKSQDAKQAQKKAKATKGGAPAPAQETADPNAGEAVA